MKTVCFYSFGLISHRLHCLWTQENWEPRAGFLSLLFRELTTSASDCEFLATSSVEDTSFPGNLILRE